MLDDARWAAARLLLRTAGRTSRGIRIGYRHGFDSGTMLDYVYENRSHGVLGAGRLIDRVYLNAVGWRAIRARAVLLKRTLREEAARRGHPLKILDVAAGPGRYLQEFLAEDTSRHAHRVLCRDLAPAGLRRGAATAAERRLLNIAYERGDAFAPEPPAFGPPDVIVVSGLYELLLDDEVIRASMASLRELLAPGGTLVFTTQTRHPQLDFIANVLPNRFGERWVMKCRPAGETEVWAKEAGFTDVASRVEDVGLFAVTTAR
ncbi:class I SAM-dependent methyltransferase family protein [Spirillospora sp. NBC_01491]|uniref:class I SAM-dependent methyltransferase family protein n=1 Tax=Spirillospora sp. NBC_01491 TaxID=2976007 RepID=UPI002E361881|nr:class I SAM-dependent methyltransferase family protein [Spirillospora sp. NBC_01491]